MRIQLGTPKPVDQRGEYLKLGIIDLSLGSIGIPGLFDLSLLHGSLSGLALRFEVCA
jgi:hypothetical protein